MDDDYWKDWKQVAFRFGGGAVVLGSSINDPRHMFGNDEDWTLVADLPTLLVYRWAGGGGVTYEYVFFVLARECDWTRGIHADDHSPTCALWGV